MSIQIVVLYLILYLKGNKSYTFKKTKVQVHVYVIKFVLKYYY